METTRLKGITPKLLKDGFALLPHQIDSTRELVKLKRAVLVDVAGNGKTACCLYGFAFLKKKGFLDTMFVFTPVNAYKKKVWLSNIERHTNLRCCSFDEWLRSRSVGVSVEDLLQRYDVVYAKHGHFKTHYKELVQILSMSSRKILSVVDECFTGETLILCRRPGDGKIVYLTIEWLVKTKAQYEVCSYVNGSVEFHPITHWFDNGEKDVYALRFKSYVGPEIVVQCTINHLFNTPRGWVPAGDLQQGDMVYGVRDVSLYEYVPIAYEFLDRQWWRKAPVYDLEVADSHSFIANGLSVHNCHWMKNPKADLTQSSSLVLRHAYAVWGLTATMLSKNCMDIYNIINFIYPGYLGSEWAFKRRYCKMYEKVVGRLPNGELRKCWEISGWQNLSKFAEDCRGVMVLGSESLKVDLHFIDYEMGPVESDLYHRISKGLLDTSVDNLSDWVHKVLSDDYVASASSVRSLKSLDQFGSRYIYLQSVVDGSLRSDGTFGYAGSAKMDRFLSLVQEIVSKNQSCLVYCDYYSTLDALQFALQRSGIRDARGESIIVVEQSARNNYKKGLISGELSKLHSYVVLCSQGASESADYEYLNHVIFYDLPITPKGYFQMGGRITRRNTWWLGDLHYWLFRSDNIDLYKLHMVGFKVYMQAAASPDVKNFPAEYVKEVGDAKALALAKKFLLWRDGVTSSTSPSSGVRSIPKKLQVEKDLFSE